MSAAVARSHAYHPLTVREVVRETADASSFVLDIPAESADRFSYRAGQFCTFRAEIGGAEVLRCYSMSSAPTSGDTDKPASLTVTVKRVASGAMSNWLNDTVAVGDVLYAQPPSGVFCATGGDAPIVAFAAGSGITPIMSIIRSVLPSGSRPVRLLYANRDRASTIFADDLDALAAASPDTFDVTHHHDVEHGFVTVEQIVAIAAASPDAGFYICGPTPFMDLVEGVLLGAGVHRDRILLERFGANPDRIVDSTEVPSAESAAPAKVTLLLKGRRTTVDYVLGDTVIDAGRRVGLTPPFSCEQGNCATCMAIVTKGAVRMKVNNALTDEELAEGWVLTCQAIPIGDTDVTIEYQ